MAVPVLHRDTHHARQATDGEPMRELDQIQQQTFQLLQSMLGASPFAEIQIPSGNGGPSEPAATT